MSDLIFTDAKILLTFLENIESPI